MCEALGSIPVLGRKKKEGRKEGRKVERKERVRVCRRSSFCSTSRPSSMSWKPPG
jgi:hypothetical protein